MNPPSFILAAFLLLLAAPADSQRGNYGGCAEGREIGYVTVQDSVSLREWDSGRHFLTVAPGDEFRLCRFENSDAVVTLWARGYGYRLPRTAVGTPSLPTARTLSGRELACIVDAIDSIQRQHRSREQGRRFLVLARRWNVTIHQIELARTQAIRIIGSGGSLPSPTDCERP